ncbi:hypothetical protein [Leptospira neocaledonica]|uniref:Uncharacterized protein n=1 Tax=Leptospira neocaledonica TaxID=2023192 RepID=A0A2M9ZUN5_9LEPT|nr:hypothetical protein [Leptospira neocaledonica]PJZ75797.1 hypothetical protein CH365_17480 [Leptospira neocaledonica]
MRRPRFYLKSIAVFLIFVLGFSNCAVFNRNNTPLVIKVEENLVPEETGYKILAAPVYIPLGLVAVILDLIIVHPIIRIPDAFNDTVKLLWTPRDAGYVTRMGFLPISTAMTPVVFILDLFARSSFDINGNTDYYQSPAPKRTVNKALESGDSTKILKLLESFDYAWPPDLCQKIIEKFPADREIVKLSLYNILYSISSEDEPRYVSYLNNFLNWDLKVDKALGEYFIRSNSLAGISAMVSILASKKVSKETEDIYINTVLQSGRVDQVLELVNLYLKTPDKRKKIIYLLESKNINYKLSNGEYEDGEFVVLLNKDPRIDNIILHHYIWFKSSKASEVITKLVVSGKIPKASVNNYIITILRMGVEKDVRAIVQKFPRLKEMDVWERDSIELDQKLPIDLK